MRDAAEQVTVGSVFVPNRTPTITYNPREPRGLETVLKRHVDSPQEMLLILGPTKSGKTVLVRRAIPDDKRIDVEGTRVLGDESAVWKQAAKQLALASTLTEREGSTNDDADVSAGFTLNLGFVTLNFGRKSGQKRRSTSAIKSFQVDLKEEVLDTITKQGKVLVIDDFHVVHPDVQRAVVQALKGPVSHGMRVVLIGIPHRGNDVERAMSDMGDRVRRLMVPIWEKSELAQIADKGFAALNIEPAANMSGNFSTHAYGSPQLMQRFCLHACQDHGYLERQPEPAKMRMKTTYDKFFQEFAEHSNNDVRRLVAEYRTPTAKLKKRKLQDGAEANIYQLILMALKRCLPDTDIAAGEIAEAISAIAVKNDQPALNEITSGAKRLAELAQQISDEEQLGQAVIEWDDKTRTLQVTDASFAFHVKWGPI